MRITGGKARAIQLQVPRGDSTRPTTDRLREAVFSSLGQKVEGAIVLDLFAGTGSYGLEALSRGAQSAYFVEHYSKVLPCLKTNVENVLKSAGRSKDCAHMIQADALNWQPVNGVAFDLIFIDPPYAMWPQIATSFFHHLAAIQKAQAYWIIEYLSSSPPVIPAEFHIQKTLNTGKNNPQIMMLQSSICTRP